MAAESRAKIVYEYLLQFTEDPLVRESLQFLMTREIAHFQMFGAALETVQPNFPPGIQQGEQRFTHLYFQMSDGGNARGPWNEGQGPWRAGEQWVYIEDPITQVRETRGQLDTKPQGSTMSQEEANKFGNQLGEMRSSEIKEKIPTGPNQWSSFPQTRPPSPTTVDTAK